MPKKKTVTAEEAEAMQLQRSLEDLKERDQFIPDPPPYLIFKVGDRVQHGNIDKSIVTEVIDGGRIYKLHEDHLENHYGKLIPTVRDIYISWIDLTIWRSQAEHNKTTQFSIENKLNITFYQMDMSGIFGKLYHFGIDMNPDYQRGNVWGQEDKTRLIDSVFQNVEIGKFVFIQLPFKHLSPAYEVLDGKQRVIALSEFYESRWKYKGLYYNDLCLRDQSHFEHYPVSVAVVRNEDVKLSDKYLYFLKLNVSGKPQDPNHLAMVRKLYEQAIKEGK